jgi:molecular chaperone DnaK (HSP70)
VITVPPYFNQAERKSVLRAAEIANLKVLQLINTNVAGKKKHNQNKQKKQHRKSHKHKNSILKLALTTVFSGGKTSTRAARQ